LREIVGLAGLEGHGQKALLRAIHEAGRQSAGAVTRAAPASFVSGDRRKGGVSRCGACSPTFRSVASVPALPSGSFPTEPNAWPPRRARSGFGSTSPVSIRASSSSAAVTSRRRWLAGIPVDRVVATAFVISSVLASFMGLTLGAYVGGAFLEMGQPYLLQSVAAGVIGGTLIFFGGSASAIGVFFASVLLILLVTLMQIMQLPPGSQDMVQGVVVILVLALALQKVGVAR
jgi:Branched-chain amino acid transport system / permease component